MTTGFIILRHVNNALTDKYWKHSYDCVRKFYPDAPVVILEDNSKLEYVTPHQLTNAKVISSEGSRVGAGELLPYIYFHENKWFDRAVIIHDGVFANSYQDFSDVEEYQFLWHFKSHAWDHPEGEIPKLSLFNDVELLQYHVNHLDKWVGCFGVMSIITHKFLTKVFKSHNFNLIAPAINTRKDRENCERIVASTFQYHSSVDPISKFGDIKEYCPWGVDFYNKDKMSHLPFIKVWTGR